ncbi:hypothetical protein AB0B27_14050 [Micromonospora rifamycinica]|uniref:hypothetical protein n=1 Tax=Micromonospora rifamycinica TaxID=291594 RepID=UPI0033C933E9
MSDLHLHLSEGLVLRAGDTLVIAMESARPSIAQQIVGELEAMLPEVEIVVVGGASALAAYRPNAVECSTITTDADHGADPGHGTADHPSTDGEGRVDSLQVRGVETLR